MKLLLIPLLIIGLVIGGLMWARNKIRSIFAPMSQNPNYNQRSKQSQSADNDQVLYNKDDIVVMKGEAGKKDKK